MTVVAVCAASGGAGVTTTTVVLAANWPANDVAVAELDPTGGDLAAWSDTPDTGGTSALAARRWDGSLASLEAQCWSTLATRTPAICGPTRRLAAAAVIDAIAENLVRGFAASTSVLLADGGPLAPNAPAAWITSAAALVVVVRQDPRSAPVSAARLDRTGELIDSLRAQSLAVFALSIGERPFSTGEISAHLGVPTVSLASDPLGASLIADPNAVTRTLQRCGLYRSARGAAIRLASATDTMPITEDAP